jgi:hypothetical protein
MEFVEGGDIYTLIKKRKRLTERPCAIILKGCADALNELHKFYLKKIKILDQNSSIEI